MVEVVKKYRTRTVLGPVTLRVPEATTCVLLGPNGAGKSTLLEIVSTLRHVTSGSVRLCGVDVSTHPRQARRMIGVTLQSQALDTAMSPRALLRLQARARGLSARAAARRAIELLDAIGLAERAGEPASRLSGGQRRRVDLAMALVTSPRVLLLDEPTVGIDPEARLGIWDHVRAAVRDDGTTVLCSTQDLAEAQALATSVAVLRDGRLVVEGPPGTLAARTGPRVLRVTLGSPQQAAAVAREHGGVVPDPDASIAHVAIPDDASLPRALQRLVTDPGVEIADLHVDRPGLDDVFRAVIGAAGGIR